MQMRQRVDSQAFVGARYRNGKSVLAELDQRGGAKVRLPATAVDGLDAVLINTAGGLTGGDRVQWRCRAHARARLRVSTAASEKAYRSHGPSGQQHALLQAESGAHLSWLPQETIVFEGASLERSLSVELAADASCLICEALVFGRQAMGERLNDACIKDTWHIHRDGKLLHKEALQIDASVDLCPCGSVAAFGLGSELAAMATVLLCDARDSASLELLADRLRAIDTATGTLAGKATVGVSVLPGRLLVRLLAEDGWQLRQLLVPLLTQLQSGDDVPRVWHV